MTRTQGLVIGILLGGVLLVFMGLMAMFLFFPGEQLEPAAPTAPLPPPGPTPTATLPNFMPTPGLDTPTAEPTATYTRVPSPTPLPTYSPTPTTDFKLPTLAIKPTATATVADTPIPQPTVTNTPAPPTPIPPRQYTISFRAEESTIVEDECTDLIWETTGLSVVRLDGQSVAVSGKKEVCPTRDTSYELAVQLPDSPIVESRIVKIKVEEKAEE